MEPAITPQLKRQDWMATLAKADPDLLERHVCQLGDVPSYGYLRSPEIGLVMVRGRAGGSGQPFNLGEMPIVRCVVQLAPSVDREAIAGFSYVAGRSRRHAELAALCDALLQHPDWHEQIQSEVIQPLQEMRDRQKATQDRQTAATKVNFLTMLRGEVLS
jgi:alpha-D-ribose 1-methylphosphonate 5-triphosphate synthase subunit PhnG